MATTMILQVALVGAMLFLSGANAYGGRRLACSTPGCVPDDTLTCITYTGGMSTSTSQTKFTSDFTTAFRSCLKSVCNNDECIDQEDCLEESVTVTAEALAMTEVALAETCARAMATVMGRGFVSGPPDCKHTSTASAAAKARALAKAIAGSYATALTRVAGVPGSAAYNTIMATYNQSVSAFQERCATEVAIIAPETVPCSPKSPPVPCGVKTGGSWTFNYYSEAIYRRFLGTVNFDAQMESCVIVDCAFSNEEEDATALARASTRAIAEAMSTMTIEADQSCTYDGEERNCAPFATLCDSTCAFGQCPTPTFTNTVCDMADVNGDAMSGEWQELSNGFYACNYCGSEAEEVEVDSDACADGCPDEDGCACAGNAEWKCPEAE